MQRWEYCTVEYASSQGEILKLRKNGEYLEKLYGTPWLEFLDQLGEEGWELIATAGSNVFWTLYFKRPKRDE